MISNRIKILYIMVLIIFQLIYPAISFASPASIGWHFFSGFSGLESKIDKSNSADPNFGFHLRLPVPFQDDITSDQDLNKVKLTPKQKHQALVWGLSKNQEKRYVLLMQNKSGFYYKNLPVTPIEVLGMNARDDKERTYYAQLATNQELQKTAKFLAFYAAFNKYAMELKREYSMPMIREFSYTKYSPYNYQPVNLQSGDKLFLFVRLSDSVRPIISSLISSIAEDNTIQLNIYFVDRRDKRNKENKENKNITEEQIKNWAKSQYISPEMVSNQEITLNLDNKRFEELNEKNEKNEKNNKIQNKTPLLILVRNGISKKIDTGRF